MARGTWQGSGTWQTTSSGSGGGLVLAVIAAAVLIGSGAVTAAISALAVIAITIAVVTGVAVTAGIAVVVWRLRRPPRPGVPYSPLLVQQATRAPLQPAQPRAVDPPRQLHLHLTVTPDQAAAIMRQHDLGEDWPSSPWPPHPQGEHHDLSRRRP